MSSSYLTNIMRYYIDLLICLPSIVDFEMIVKFLPKSCLLVFGKNFHEILWWISINIFKHIINLIDDDYWHLPKVHVVFLLIKLSMHILEAIFTYPWTALWDYFELFLWDPCHSKEDFSSQIGSYNGYIIITFKTYVWEVWIQNQWHWKSWQHQLSLFGHLPRLYEDLIQWSCEDHKPI